MKMAFILISSFIFLLSSAHADEAKCLEKLTNNHRQDSMVYSLDVDAHQLRDFGNDFLAHAIQLVRTVLEIKGCQKNDINFARSSFGRSYSRCRYLAPGRSNSLSCYVESNLGYFFVTQDFLSRAHVTFNRWD